MTTKSEEIVDKAIKDPEKFYKTPESVLSDDRLTQEQKDKILRCWEQDQVAMMRADGENMTQKANASPAVEVLEKVKEAEKVLKNAAEEEKAA